MSVASWLLERSLVYRIWQAPFVDAKLAPLRAGNELAGVRRVLDVGCGPGTNAALFEGLDYLGVDINARYITDARRRHPGRRFEVADVTTFQVKEGRFDFILVNSLLHHLDDTGVARLLAHLATLLSTDGHAHILELELPPGPSPARALARLDRGKYARPRKRWREIFEAHFVTERFEPYALRGLGVPLWRMIYFKGRARP
jgi:SAM-dependent methyltransferase